MPINTIIRSFFSIYYNQPNYVDVVWTPITAVEGNFPINIQLQPYNIVLIRATDANMYNIIYFFSNGTSTVHSINFSLSGSVYKFVFVSQQVLYTDGKNFEGSLNFIAKNTIHSISIEYKDGKNISNWVIKFVAKFE